MPVVLFITKSVAVNKNKTLLSSPDNSNHQGIKKKISSYQEFELSRKQLIREMNIASS